ncbi:MAG: ABC transporter permease [Clostridiales bacterium]|jgi:oligopeptide transport system permease protein|nr:ABC transporter permease [Clostridiales bacterium]
MSIDLQELPDELFEPLEQDPASLEMTGFSNYSYWGSTLRTFAKSKLSIILISVIGILVAFSFIYPIFGTDPNTVYLDTTKWNQKASLAHPFGTDGLGRDIFSRTWHGTRNSLMLAMAIALVEIGVGTIVGAFWGYMRNLDPIMLELYNIITNIPSTVYLVLMSYIMRPSFVSLVIVLASRGWISEAKFMRNRVLSIRESEYNIASQCLGAPIWRIVLKNIIPYIISLVIMETALTVPSSIGSEVFLGFVGLGLPIDTISLGNLVNQGRSNFLLYPQQLLLPAGVLCVITVSFYIAGNRFADASDPKNHV